MRRYNEGYVEDVEENELGAALRWEHEVGGCILTASQPELKSRLVFTISA